MKKRWALGESRRLKPERGQKQQYHVLQSKLNPFSTFYVTLLLVRSPSMRFETPFGKRDQMLGERLTFQSPPFLYRRRVVAVVSGDFGADELAVFAKQNVDTTDPRLFRGRPFVGLAAGIRFEWPIL